MSPKFGMYFTLKMHFNSDASFSEDIFNLYLDFIKFTVEKQTIYSSFSKHLKHFLTIEKYPLLRSIKIKLEIRLCSCIIYILQA